MEKWILKAHRESLKDEKREVTRAKMRLSFIRYDNYHLDEVNEEYDRNVNGIENKWNGRCETHSSQSESPSLLGMRVSPNKKCHDRC